MPEIPDPTRRDPEDLLNPDGLMLYAHERELRAWAAANGAGLRSSAVTLTLAALSALRRRRAGELAGEASIYRRNRELEAENRALEQALEAARAREADFASELEEREARLGGGAQDAYQAGYNAGRGLKV